MKRAQASELRAFLGAFGPEIARIALRLRGFVLEQAPMCNEFVDRSEDVVTISYGLTELPGDTFCHVAVHAGWVNLEFDRGSQLPDPEGLLRGSGPSTRHVRIASLDDLRRPLVGQFLRSAMRAAAQSGSDTGKRSAARPVVRGVYAKERRPDKPAPKKEGA